MQEPADVEAAALELKAEIEKSNPFVAEQVYLEEHAHASVLSERIPVRFRLLGDPDRGVCKGNVIPGGDGLPADVTLEGVRWLRRVATAALDQHRLPLSPSDLDMVKSCNAIESLFLKDGY